MQLMWSDQTQISEMLNKTFVEVKEQGDEELVFTSDSGEKFIFYHSQDCCEYVHIEDIEGNLSDLEGSPLLQAEESSSDAEYAGESGTWTFYKFATIKGYVTVRWLGTSNGYYSEGVSLRKA